MSTNAIGPSERDVAFDGLMKDLLAKIDTKFSDLEKSTQDKFIGAVSEIAKLSDKVVEMDTGYRQRFHAAQRQVGGGDYGIFRDRETASMFGKVIASQADPQNAANYGSLAELQKAAAVSGTGPQGGYLLQPSVAEEIINNLEEYGVVEKYIKAFPLAGEIRSIPRISQGATVYYPDEGNAPTESQLKVARTQIQPTRHSVLVYMDRWMLASLPALAVFYVNEMRRALAAAVDANVFIGDGTSTYARHQGILTRTASPHLVTTGITGDNTIQKMIDKTSYYIRDVVGKITQVTERDNPGFFMHRTVFFGYLGAQDTTGKPIADLYAGGQRNFWGYPIDIVQACPSVSQTAVSKVFLAFGALRAAWAGVRHISGLELRQSEHVKFLEGQIATVLDVPQRYEEVDPTVMSTLQVAAS